MNVTITHALLPALPPPTGPHELAWSYILDAVFADAYHAGVTDLDVEVPTADLDEDVQLRAELSGQQSEGSSRAVMTCRPDAVVPNEARKWYRLGFGRLAPAALRTPATAPPAGWRHRETWGYFTLAARFWGLPIRAAYVLRRPDLADRAMAAMRRRFARPGDRSAYYVLDVWSRS